MVAMPSRIDTFTLKYFKTDYTLIIILNSYLPYLACLITISENSILWCALHCVMGLESYGDSIFLKSIAMLYVLTL